jgi:hypothetical protein
VTKLAHQGVVFRPLLEASASVELAIANRASDSSAVIDRFTQLVRECAPDPAPAKDEARRVRPRLVVA